MSVGKLKRPPPDPFADLKERDERAKRAGDEERAKRPGDDERAKRSEGDERAEPARPPRTDWREEVPQDAGPAIRFGILLLVAFLGAFLVWAATAPLGRAVVAPGKLVPDGQHQKVQHQRGGRVVAIHVRDGDFVQRGETIVVLDPITDRAELGRLTARRRRLEAMRARLMAELENRDLRATEAMRRAGLERTLDNLDGVRAGVSIRGGIETGRTLPIDGVAAERYGEIVSAQLDEFAAGRARLERELASLRAQSGALTRQREGVEAQARSQNELLDMTRSELRRLRPLAESGFIARSRVRERERELAEIEGRLATLESERLALQDRLADVSAKIELARQRDREAVTEELGRVLGELSETGDQLRAARTAVDRAAVRAPVSGTVVKMVQNTVNGTVASGDVIAEIVPLGTTLVAEGRVRPSDIAGVRVDQRAEVMVTAHNRREKKPMRARVVYVAADSTRDEENDDPFFLVRLVIDDPDPDLRAGMQAELFLAGEPRTFLDYVLEPLTASFDRAFRER